MFGFSRVSAATHAANNGDDPDIERHHRCYAKYNQLSIYLISFAGDEIESSSIGWIVGSIQLGHG
jgi:hypothetical protein